MARPGPVVSLSPRQRAILERIARSRTLSQRLVERAKFVLGADEGVSGTELAKTLGVDEQRTRRWRNRWAAEAPRVDQAEAAGASDRDLTTLIESLLGDRPRTGTPATFSPEVVTQLIALACESPEDSGLPITHWTPEELAEEAKRRGIVESISARHLDRLLKRGRPSTAQE